VTVVFVGFRDNVERGLTALPGRRGRYRRPVSALSCSGGKDSALALHELRKRPGGERGALITMVTTDYERISMHGVRRQRVSGGAARAGR
jgi:hypothetical protein